MMIGIWDEIMENTYRPPIFKLLVVLLLYKPIHTFPDEINT